MCTTIKTNKVPVESANPRLLEEQFALRNSSARDRDGQRRGNVEALARKTNIWMRTGRGVRMRDVLVISQTTSGSSRFSYVRGPAGAGLVETRRALPEREWPRPIKALPERESSARTEHPRHTPTRTTGSPGPEYAARVSHRRFLRRVGLRAPRWPGSIVSCEAGRNVRFP